MDFLFQVFPIEHMWQPHNRISKVELAKLKLPTEAKRIYEENVPRERNKTIIHAVRVLQVNLRVLNVITREEQQLSLPIEF